jgi:hypothetical protein
VRIDKANRRARLLAALTLVTLGAAACGGGGGGGGGGTVTPPPPPTARFEDQFGAEFGAAFRGVSASEPANVAPGAVIAPSLTAEPVAVP